MARIERVAALVVAVVLVSSCSGGSEDKVELSPQVRAYVDAAVKVLDRGLFATGPSWRKELDRARNKMYAAPTIPDTYGELDELAVRAGGTHSSFRSPAVVSKLQKESYDVPTVTAADGIATLTIPGLGRLGTSVTSRYEAAAATAIEANLKHATCGWIVDLRSNFGGDVWPMFASVSPLLTNALVMSFIDRDKHADRVTVRGLSALESGKEISALRGGHLTKLAGAPVAVLQSQITASAGEAVLVSFIGQPKVRTFGQSTAGFSTGNATATLADGAELVVTVSVYADRSGKTYGHRIDPQTRTPAGGSAIPKEAIDWLKTECR